MNYIEVVLLSTKVRNVKDQINVCAQMTIIDWKSVLNPFSIIIDYRLPSF